MSHLIPPFVYSKVKPALSSFIRITYFNEQPEEPTPAPRRRAPQRYSRCETVEYPDRFLIDSYHFVSFLVGITGIGGYGASSLMGGCGENGPLDG